MRNDQSIRALSIMAHQDDFEFNAGGFFALLRLAYGKRVRLKILATTRGASGHHDLSLETTFRRREKEAQKSAALLGAEYECLTGLDGNHVPNQLFIDRNTLGGLWNAIRRFAPDVIVCPPVITDPRAAIHIDHYNTAWATRMVGYQLSVPHAYPANNGTPTGWMKPPLIVNVDDAYARENGYDVALDISRVYPLKEKMALCHESQIFEWLPWNGGAKPNRAQFRKNFRTRHATINRRYGLPDDMPREFFRLTRWGRCPQPGDMDRLFPNGVLSATGKTIFAPDA